MGKFFVQRAVELLPAPVRPWKVQRTTSGTQFQNPVKKVVPRQHIQSVTQVPRVQKQVLYTTQLTKKAKTWLDGKLVIKGANVELFDDDGQILAKGKHLQGDEEFRVQQYLVQLDDVQVENVPVVTRTKFVPPTQIKSALVIRKGSISSVSTVDLTQQVDVQEHDQDVQQVDEQEIEDIYQELREQEVQVKKFVKPKRSAPLAPSTSITPVKLVMKGWQSQRQLRLPDKFEDPKQYLTSILNTSLECLQISLNEVVKETPPTKRLLYHGSHLSALSMYIQHEQKYQLTVQDKIDKKLHARDDIWAVSVGSAFHSADTVLFRSTWHTPSIRNTFELSPLNVGQNQAVIDRLIELSKVSKNLVAWRIMKTASELMVIDNMRTLMRDRVPFPLLPHIMGSTTSFNIAPGMLRLEQKTSVFATVTRYIEKYQLNMDQQAVVENFVASLFDGHRQPITLCHGVFGAGKSFLLSVLVVLLHDIFNQCDLLYSGEHGNQEIQVKILISSNTNVAVDRIMVGVHELCAEEFQLLRIGPIKKIDRRILPYTLKHGAGEEQIKDLQQMYDAPGLSEADEANIGQTLKNFKYIQDQDTLKKAFLVGATCISSLSQALQGSDISPKVKFPIVFLDECSQMTEALSLLPLGQYDTQYALLIGDPLQLPPAVPYASPILDGFHGCERTLFERIRDMGNDAIMLRTQYRCHPDISGISNKLFYDGKLMNGQITRPKLLPQFQHVNYIEVSYSKETYCKYSGSFYNESEAKFIYQWCQENLFNQESVQSPLLSSEVGIISLYKRQADYISSIMNPPENENKVTTSTVDAFQGAEKQVILVSTVRSSPNGRLNFIEDSRRVNVALTRAKTHLFIFGHKETLLKSQLWSQIIKQ